MTLAYRNEIILELLPIIRKVAFKLYSPLTDDLTSCGVIGALQAIPKWNPNGGASIKRWALFRALGAMKDYLRSGRRSVQPQFVPIIDCSDSRINTFDDVALSEQRSILMKAIDEVSNKKHRRMLHLVIEGKTHKEAANAVGLSVNRLSQVTHKVIERAKGI